VKRFWTTAEYRRQQGIRRHRDERRIRRKTKRAPRPVHRRVARGRLNLIAPPRLSVLDEPEDTIEFFNSLHASLSQRQSRVFIDFRDVVRVSSDALLLMRAAIDDCVGLYANVGGNMPSNAAVAAKFKQSGFFSGFVRPPGILPEPLGMMRRKSNRLVDSEIAGDLVKFAIEHASFPSPIADASYKSLVELMANTHNHAANSRGHLKTQGRREKWFASAYCENNTAYFTFVDLGVGILRSAAPRSFLKSIGRSLFSYGEPQLLREVFQGIIGASSAVPGRGFGLPTMRSSAEAGGLPQLRVLTSSVVGEIAPLTFRSTKTRLRGTVFRWMTGDPSVES